MISFENLVDRIYHAATEPDIWSDVLHDLGQTVDAPVGLLLMWRTGHWIGSQVSRGTPPGIDTYLTSDARTRSITTPRLLSANHAGFLSSAEWFTEEEYRNDPFTTEWHGPAGLHHCAATAIHLPNGDVAVVQFSRRKGVAKMSRADLAKLDAFRPHLARTALLAARWRLERLRAATEALDLVGLPAVVLDSLGRVIAANKPIEKLSACVVWRSDNRIAFIDRAANNLLINAVGAMKSPSTSAVRSFPVRLPARCEAMVAHLIPMTGGSRDFFDGGYGILIITPVSHSGPIDTALLQGLFDLTPCEARLASGIAEGLSLEQLAARYSVTRDTVRTQTKAVFAKTGTNRQAQLASLLAGSSKFFP
jgi:DNA-binding CsgD family transcriptional regulator